MRALKLAIAALALALPIVAVPGPAAALETIVEEYHFTAKKWCGVPGLNVVVDGTFTATFETRTRGSDDTEYFAQHVEIVETHTANGVTTTYVESSLGKDLKVTVTEDTVEVIFLATGNATLYGPDGSALGRNPGQVRFRVVFDAQTGEELSFELIFGSTGRSDDFCEVEVPLLSG